MISNLHEIITLANEYSKYLERAGVGFDERGFPVLLKSAFLDEWPDQMVAYGHRHARYVKNASKTVLCFYGSDVENYRRLERVMKDLPEYGQYLGVVASDVSVIRGMEAEWEDFIMLVNQLFMAILAVNGIKIVVNLRSGSKRSEQNFSNIPSGVMCSSGTLGCDGLSSPADFDYASKILRVRPSKLLIYGKQDRLMEEQLNTLGVNFRRYDDAHRVYKLQGHSCDHSTPS